MALDIKTFRRKPLFVEAVTVTAENMAEVARWCGGRVKTDDSDEPTKGQDYIKVKVKRPLNDRQTRAYIDDKVLKAGASFKVYTPKAFEISFEEEIKHMVEVVGNMVAREEAEDKAEAEHESSLTEDPQEPFGGFKTSFVSAE
jgi:hypothetical protein